MSKLDFEGFKIMAISVTKKQALSGLGLAAGLGVLMLTAPVNAQSTTAVDSLSTETAKLTGVYDVIVPIAVGSGVFAMAFQFVKRVAYA